MHQYKYKFNSPVAVIWPKGYGWVVLITTATNSEKFKNSTTFSKEALEGL